MDPNVKPDQTQAAPQATPPVANQPPAGNPVIQTSQTTPAKGSSGDSSALKSLSMVLAVIVVIMAVVVGGLFLIAISKKTKTASKTPQTVVIPTVIPTPTPSPVDVDSLDTGNPQTDLDNITKDVQGL